MLTQTREAEALVCVQLGCSAVAEGHQESPRQLFLPHLPGGEWGSKAGPGTARDAAATGQVLLNTQREVSDQ